MTRHSPAALSRIGKNVQSEPPSSVGEVLISSERSSVSYAYRSPGRANLQQLEGSDLQTIYPGDALILNDLKNRDRTPLRAGRGPFQANVSLHAIFVRPHPRPPGVADPVPKRVPFCHPMRSPLA
jgi:hypothetical protein